MSNVKLKGFEGLNFLLSSESMQSIDKMFLEVSIDSLKPNQYQPRSTFDPKDLGELVESIKSQGIIQPLIVRKICEKNFEIVAGERRWRAAQLSGLTKVPVICRELPDATVLAFALIENIQRKELNIIDEATAIKRLIDQFSKTQEEIAKMLGKARPTISNMLRLLNLHDTVKQKLIDNLLEIGHAKLLLSFPYAEQSEIADIVVSKKLTVRETERLVNSYKNPKINKIMNSESDERVMDWQERLSMYTHAEVKIKFYGEGKGRVVMHFESIDEIEWLIKKFESR